MKLICILLCASSLFAAPNAPYHYRDDLRGQANNYRGSQEREGHIIRFFKDVAERKGDELTIKIKDGDPQVFVNEKKNKDGSVVFYSLVDVHSKNHTLVVEKGRDEGATYRLIHYDNGKSMELGGLPYWSPSGKRFAVMNTGLTDFSPALVHIWKLEKGDFVREWEMMGYIADAGRWASDDRIDFAMQRLESQRFSGERRRETSREERWECRYRPKHFNDTVEGWLCRSDTDGEGRADAEADGSSVDGRPAMQGDISGGD